MKVFDFQPYFLPPPSAIWEQFKENPQLIWDATKVSGLNALDRTGRGDGVRDLRSRSCWDGSDC